MDEQRKLFSVPYQYIESTKEKRRKRKEISTKERRAQGIYISPRTKDQIEKILNNIHKKDTR